MRKEDIVVVVSRATGISQRNAKNVIDEFLKTITKALSSGEKVTLAGFGVFEGKKYAPRTGRNPHTDEEVPIPERYVPSFRPGNRLKKAATRIVQQHTSR